MNIDKVRSILQSPDNLESLFVDPSLSGFSGRKILALLQNIACCLDPKKEVYLEVGVFRGLSLMSVSKVYKGNTFGIDNFSQFDPDKSNYNLIREHCSRLNIENATLINCDFEIALRNIFNYTGNKKTGLYFIDGPHDYRSQLMCLLLARPFLSDNAVIIIDDSNYRDVRQANDDFLNLSPSFKIVFEKYTSAHPQNMSPEEKVKATDGWWNGINVMVYDNDNYWPQRKITTITNRMLYYNDQYVHSSRYADCAPEALKVANALHPFRLLKLFARLVSLYKNIKKSDPMFHGKFRHLNTYTDNLA